MTITEALETILGARYGREVRQAIHDGIKQAYDDAIKNGNANMEVSQARGSYPTLAERLMNLDKVDKDNLNELTGLLADKIQKGNVTMADLTQEVKEVLNGDRPLPIVGKDAVGTVNIIDEAVTFHKIKGGAVIKGVNIYQRSMTTDGSIVSNTGAITTSASGAYATVPVNPNSTYSIWRGNDYFNIGAGALVVDYGTRQDVIDMNQHVKGTYLNFKYITIETGEGAKSIKFNTKMSNWDNRDDIIVISGTFGEAKEITNIFGADVVDKVSNGKYIDKTISGHNIYNNSEITILNNTLLNNEGKISTASGWKMAKIPVEPNSKYEIWFPTGNYSGGIGSVGCVDENMTVLKYEYSFQHRNIGHTYQGVTTRIIETPANTTHLLVNVANPTGRPDTYDVSETLKVFTEGDPNAPKLTGAFGYSIQSGIDLSINPLYGKQWGCIGDSLTDINARTSKRYYDYIVDETKINPINLGVSGTGYKRTEEIGTAFYQRVESMPTELDVITIFGSGNDLGASGGLGTASDTGTDTIAGAINTTIDNLQAKYPLIPIGIITPTPWNNLKPSTDNEMRKYVDLLIEIAKGRGIPYLDLYRTSGLRPWDSAFKQIAYSKDDGNGVHPDENGHKMFYPQIREFVKKLI